jgi:iron-regulated transporter 1
VYYSIPDLERVAGDGTTAPQHAGNRSNTALRILRATQGTVRQSLQIFRGSLDIYFNQPPCIPSIAASILYLTVLSFSGSMVSYLLSIGYESTYVGIARSASIVSEISATWLAPILMNRIGPIRTGLWFINWQAGCLALATALFWWADNALVASHILVAGVVASRVGLWGFDLTTQIIIQEARS